MATRFCEKCGSLVRSPHKCPFNDWEDISEEYEWTPEKEQKVIDYAFQTLSEVYILLNKFARGDHMQQWSRVDHESIIGEVYGMLAPVHIKLKELASEKAKRPYKLRR